MPEENFRAYLKEIRKHLDLGDSSEHTHRSALGILIESLDKDIVATNEPSHIAVGAPDFNIRRKKLLIGHIECKDVGVDLGAALKTDQLKRYRENLPNIILTDYINFIWFRNKKEVDRAHIAKFDSKGKPKLDKETLPRLQQLFENFLKVEPVEIGDPRKLAEEMARPARMIRDTIRKIFGQEKEKGPLHGQLAAFKEVLLPGLNPHDFADMYAQTIAYGLFAARTDPLLDIPHEEFDKYSAARHLPRTNPFLRWLFGEIMGPSNEEERITEWVDELATLLAHCDISNILSSFGKRTGKQDPVLHFYETFLGAYDPETKRARGVYYTPEPVVFFIVQAMDYLLKNKLNVKEGLADDTVIEFDAKDENGNKLQKTVPKVQILDPACGTASFLLEIVETIYERVRKTGNEAGWNDYVRRKLLPRLFGFELLVAPYTMAHLKLGLFLESKTGFKFEKKERLGVYLTNAIEPEIPEIKEPYKIPFALPIAKEGKEARTIKQDKPIMVVLGNPPYKGHSANTGKWITGLLKGEDSLAESDEGKTGNYFEVDGKPLDERNPKYLLDDYVKFLRFAQWRIEKTGQGIVGMITNHGYLDNPTFRGMRQQLMQTYSEIYVFDLHGNSKKKEVCPDGSKDENVFDIQQGVAIGLFIRKEDKKGPAKVYHADLWGLRKRKYKYLASTKLKSIEWQRVKPVSPYYLFTPQDTVLKPEYEKGWKITDIMPINSTGVKTHRDRFVLDFDLSALIKRIEDFRNLSISDEEIAQRYRLKDTRDWKLHERRESLSKDTNWKENFTRCLYRPFDYREYFHHEDVVELPRQEVMYHMKCGNNRGLISSRQTRDQWGALVTKYICDHKSCAAYDTNSLFPLYLYPESGEQNNRTANLSQGFIEELCKKLGMEFNHSPQPIQKGNGDFFNPRLPQELTPEDVFNYIYAVLHSPTYRTRYKAFLKIDFPRTPLTSDLKLFRSLAKKGKELVEFHLMESEKLIPVRVNVRLEPHSELQNEVVKVWYDDRQKRVYINKYQFFEKVEPDVWDFHVGGYQVCEKWLKDRKGRKLNYDDITQYQRITFSIRETIRLMSEIDESIPTWPIT
ncbi:N-6 DNA methylase [candidate division WOR-3 bacterium]|uniref:site-specific DNA-methyltransferase (adenine-specific) n=1 Tax=candidate division WOR-3 bacterium TaxID=2052148 RepID=A0A9D5QBL6_UNCW3|nr:N-6 DNA methylase [candidate division WOR-3 bacterium]MBD3363733.1 N-6 DNA methylase [candidate division WOR-3 bacterium]